MLERVKERKNMKFAIISDIHGNLPALNAVIADAERENVDKYIFVGDYCLSNPFPDECITRMKNIPNKYIIRGNEEIYLKNLDGKDQSTWTDGQMQSEQNRCATALAGHRAAILFNLNFTHGEHNMNKDAIFDNISIMGRVIYYLCY